MQLIEAAEPIFARHETFHPRYGWFRKAYSFVAEDPGIFIRDDAPVRIGVGKNMVRAIRFWGLAAKVIMEDPQSPSRRSPDIVPSPFGDSLFGRHGWDRYMEDPGTLWLLHWMLLAPPSLLPVWWLAFNEFHAVEFTDDDLEAAIILKLEVASNWTTPHVSSIRKDVSSLLRAYAPVVQSGRTGIDDILDCPLRELNLIGRSVAKNRYRFRSGAKPTLPAEILAYAALDYIVRTHTAGNTATISRLVHELGAPGRVFKLTDAEFLAAIEPAIEDSDALSLAVTTGATQISWMDDPRRIATAILNRYFGCSTLGDAADHKDPVDHKGARVVATASPSEQ